MGALHTVGGASALPINLLGQATRWLNRSQQEDLIERLIEHIDGLDGDPNVELNGDELDGSSAEDDYGAICNTGECAMAGCPVADPDTAVDDCECDEDFDLEHDYRGQPPLSVVSRTWGGRT